MRIAKNTWQHVNPVQENAVQKNLQIWVLKTHSMGWFAGSFQGLLNHLRSYEAFMFLWLDGCFPLTNKPYLVLLKQGNARVFGFPTNPFTFLQESWLCLIGFVYRQTRRSTDGKPDSSFLSDMKKAEFAENDTGGSLRGDFSSIDDILPDFKRRIDDLEPRAELHPKYDIP